jgi:predicted AAA+ superfamily ATPase
LLDKGAPRRRALSLTQSGEALARAIAKVFEDRCFRLVSEMPAEDLQRLHALLEHLQRNMGRMAILADELRLEKCGTNFDQP